MAPHRSFRDTLVVLFRITFWDEAALIVTASLASSWKQANIKTLMTWPFQSTSVRDLPLQTSCKVDYSIKCNTTQSIDTQFHSSAIRLQYRAQCNLNVVSIAICYSKDYKYFYYMCCSMVLNMFISCGIPCYETIHPESERENEHKPIT